MSEMEREERRKAESKEKPTQARPSSEKMESRKVGRMQAKTQCSTVWQRSVRACVGGGGRVCVCVCSV